jgi:hypothetical protein
MRKRRRKSVRKLRRNEMRRSHHKAMHKPRRKSMRKLRRNDMRSLHRKGMRKASRKDVSKAARMAVTAAAKGTTASDRIVRRVSGNVVACSANPGRRGRCPVGHLVIQAQEIPMMSMVSYGNRCMKSSLNGASFGTSAQQTRSNGSPQRRGKRHPAASTVTRDGGCQVR